MPTKNPLLNKKGENSPKAVASKDAPKPKATLEPPKDANSLTYSQYMIAKETGEIPSEPAEPEENMADTYSQYMFNKYNKNDTAKQTVFEEHVGKSVTITALRIDGSRPFNIASYRVEVPSLEFAVWRQWTDFNWLRNFLKQKYVGMFIPSLIPQLKAGATTAVANRRARHFVCFLEQVGSHEWLRRDPATLTFLGEKSEYEWNKYMKNAKVEEVDWLKDSDATFTQQQIDSMISDHRDMLAVHEKHLLKLQAQVKLLAKASKSVRSAVNKCSIVAKGYAEATANEKSAKAINTSLNTMTTALASWGQKSALEPAVLSEVMVPQISFQLHQVKAFRELLAVRDAVLKEMDKFEKKLDNHKTAQASGKTETRGSMFGGYLPQSVAPQKMDIKDAIQNTHGDLQSIKANFKFLTRALVESELEKFDNMRTEQYQGIVGMVAIGMIRCEADVSSAWADARSNASGIMEHVKVFIPNFDNYTSSKEDEDTEQ
jgi:hypothetical protein